MGNFFWIKCLQLVFFYDIVLSQENGLGQMVMIRQEDKLNKMCNLLQKSTDDSQKFLGQLINIAGSSTDSINKNLQTIIETIKKSGVDTQSAIRTSCQSVSYGNNSASSLTSIEDMLDTFTKISRNLTNSFEEKLNSFTSEIQVFSQQLSSLSLIKNLTIDHDELKKNITELGGLISQLLVKHDQKCIEPWVEIDTQCFLFSVNKLSWEKSRELCQQLGKQGEKVDLAEPENVFFLAHHYATFWPNSKSHDERAWIGAKGKKSEGWKWVSGKALPLSAIYWAADQPNHDSTKYACGYLLKGEIADWMCEEQYNYVCQKSA